MTAQCLLAHAILAVPWIVAAVIVVCLVASPIALWRSRGSMFPPVWPFVGTAFLASSLLVGGVAGVIFALQWAERVVRACQ